MRKWTAEERARQAALIKTWKPWEQSTGARTAEGKAASSQNALVHGGRSAETKGLQKAISTLMKGSKKVIERIIE
jgi:hypothetical protein